MIYHATSPEEGAQRLILKYNLRYVTHHDFVPGTQLAIQMNIRDPHYFIEAFYWHETIHAFVLDDGSVFFHPDVLLEKLQKAYMGYYSKVIS